MVRGYVLSGKLGTWLVNPAALIEGNRERIVRAVEGKLVSQLSSLCADDLLARECLLLLEHA